MSRDKQKPLSKLRSSLATRLLPGFIALGYYVSLCFWGAFPYCVGVAIVTAIGLSEFVYACHWSLVRTRKTADPPVPASPFAVLNPVVGWAGLGCPFAAYWIAKFHFGAALEYGCAVALLVGLFALLLAAAMRTGRTLSRLRSVYGIVALFYVGGLFSSFDLLRGLPGRIVVWPFAAADRGAWLMLFAGMCVWATDIFAFLIGSLWGRRPLAPLVSPGKTVEGAIGGLLGAIGTGLTFCHWVHLSWIHGLFIGLIAGLAGQIGDLFASAMKRDIGIKDFGRIMPGHGGLLDRADSLLFAVPLIYLYLRLVVGL